MGKGESYEFDFVPGTATVSVGTEQLEVTRESENTWSFHSTGSTSPRFTLTYDADADAYEFTAHEAISNFAPVKLAYTVKAPSDPKTPEKPEAKSPTPTTYPATKTTSRKALPQTGDPTSSLPFIATALAAAVAIGTAVGVRALKKH